jgi:hypothetical protein
MLDNDSPMVVQIGVDLDLKKKRAIIEWRMCLIHVWGKLKQTTWLNKSTVQELRVRMPCFENFTWKSSMLAASLVLIIRFGLSKSFLKNRWQGCGGGVVPRIL